MERDFQRDVVQIKNHPGSVTYGTTRLLTCMEMLCYGCNIHGRYLVRAAKGRYAYSEQRRGHPFVYNSIVASSARHSRPEAADDFGRHRRRGTDRTGFDIRRSRDI